MAIIHRRIITEEPSAKEPSIKNKSSIENTRHNTKPKTPEI